MRRFVLLIAIIVPVTLSGQELVATFTIDSSQYEALRMPFRSFSFIPGPSIPYTMISGSTSVGVSYIKPASLFLFTLRKKNTDQFDIFSYTGKIGSITIPMSDTNSLYEFRPILSQTFIDNDNGWEYIVNYDFRSGVNNFKVFDDNGNILLSDCGEAFFGYDGQNTYVSSVCFYGDIQTTLKTWRFRTNVSSSFAPGLAKTAGQPNPIMYFGASGDMRVRLQPASGGKTSVQFFDMLGRLTYTKIVDNVTQPVSFTIPSNQVPESPFVSRVKNENGYSVQKMFPVR